MTITHVVFFRLLPSVEASAAQDVSTRFVALKDQCVSPETGKPYILSVEGGKDNSIEGLQGGFTHAFIMHFVSSEDRKYYVEADPAHAAFKESCQGLLMDVKVLDFEPGVF